MPSWSWPSALVGVLAGTAATAIMHARPKNPTFHLVSISLSSFHLNLPTVDVELKLCVHVTNSNIVPIQYTATTISIYYAGTLLGTADVSAGSQPAMSCRLLQLPARLKGVELASHTASLLADAMLREMELDAVVEISGTAQVLKWSHRFKKIQTKCSPTSIGEVWLSVHAQFPLWVRRYEEKYTTELATVHLNSEGSTGSVV